VLRLCLGYFTHYFVVFKSYPCIVHLRVVRLGFYHGCSVLRVGLVRAKHLAPTLNFLFPSAIRVVGVASLLVAWSKAVVSISHLPHFL
jgi:hypothetical protein